MMPKNGTHAIHYILVSAVFLAPSFVFMQLCINCINWIKKLILLQTFLLDRLAFASSVDL